MFKNFSYIFGLGALFMLAACDSGDKKSTDGKESVAKSEKAVTETREVQQINKIFGNKQKNNKGTAEENQNEENWGIYADINHPIEDETPTSAKSNNANANKNTVMKAKNLKASGIKMFPATDSIKMSEKDGKKESENSEPEKKAVVDSMNKSDSEMREEISKTDDIQNAENIDRADNVNNVQSDAKETHIDAVNKENTEHEENSSETPEVSMVSDVPVISEESSENQPVEAELIEIDQISESTPNEEENVETEFSED